MKTIKIKLLAALLGLVATLGLLAYVASLPGRYREQGRVEERTKARNVSIAEMTKRNLELKDMQSKLENERLKNELFKNEQDKKFNDYVADVRAGRVAGLRIARNSVCASTSQEVAATAGIDDKTTVRLPREIEEGLFRFANDRDKIIIDFEAFKQEVRTAKCFAD
jgi:hypothetical protein